ncbi:DUF84 family protein [Salmonella enterica subsp. enterica]|nr:DUF84 family protein [Salmonella enterica subsp. enterica]
MKRFSAEGSCHIAPVAVESGVPEQPTSEARKRVLERNRVGNARRLHPQAVFWVASKRPELTMTPPSVGVVIDSGVQRGEGAIGALPLPAVILDGDRRGEALGQ